MFIAYLIVTLITIAANTWATAVDFAKAKSVMDNARMVGVPASWVPLLGALKGAGVIGLVIGLAGVWILGMAAAVGLTLFFICAVGLHIWRGVFSTIAFPSAFLALAVGTLALTAAQ